MAEKKKKKTPGGFTTKTEYTPGLRKKGESFMDFTTRQHEKLYPGAQRMAREAGAGGWRSFTPRGAEYRRGVREEMPWLQPGQRYMSEDWKRMLANRQTDMYGGGAQVGGAPPGRPPLPTAMGNILGRGQRPAIAPLQRKTAYMADPRNQAAAAAAQIRQTGGDASVAEAMYSSPRGIGQRYDFPPVGSAGRRQIGPTWAGANQMGGAPRPPTRVQVPMGRGYAGQGTGYQQDAPGMGAGRPSGWGTAFTMDDLNRMQQQAAARRQPRSYPGQNYGATGANLGQFPTRPASGRYKYGDPIPGYPPGFNTRTGVAEYGGSQNYGATGAFLGQFPRYPASPAGSQLPYNVLDQQRRRNLAGYPMNQETTSYSMRGNSPWYWGPPRRPRVAGQQY